MIKQTSLYSCHQKASARLVDFFGWEMPLHYGSQIKEHHAVRQDTGLFDVSHMGVVDLTGPDIQNFLRYLLANNIDKLTDNKALYTCMLNEQGGVIDDLIIYRFNPHFFRAVINAGTREKDLAWFQKQAASFNIQIKERTDLAILALQGPNVFHYLNAIFSEPDIEKIKTLKPFHFTQINDVCVARTGYTGELGFEFILPNELTVNTWNQLIKAGVTPCGLGARDTLRLEAGLNLYGADMDENITPLEANLTWTVAFQPNERNFIGRNRLEQQRPYLTQKLIGLVKEGPGVLRAHQTIQTECGSGEITSGTFSPTLNCSIALARVPIDAQKQCVVNIRNKEIPVNIIHPPFVRQGKKNF